MPAFRILPGSGSRGKTMWFSHGLGSRAVPIGISRFQSSHLEPFQHTRTHSPIWRLCVRMVPVMAGRGLIANQQYHCSERFPRHLSGRASSVNLFFQSCLSLIAGRNMLHSAPAFHVMASRVVHQNAPHQLRFFVDHTCG